MTTDNRYYKAIAEKLTGETISGVHTNNYYLNKICTSLGYTYSGVTCNGTYIKDFARHFTELTYTKIHFNNYFLKKLAEHLTGETYGNHDDNYFLGLINENIIPQPPSFTSVEVTSDKSILSYADSESATLTAQLMNGASTASVGGETVEFYRYVDGTNDVLVDSGQTDNNGVATGTYTSAGIGDIQVYAKVRTLVSETYVVSDRLLYDTTEYNRTGTGSATSVVTNNQTWDNTIDWELTADIKVTGNACRIDVVPPTESLSHHFGIGKNNSGQLSTYIGKSGGGEEAQTHSQLINNNTYYTVKVVKEGTTIKFYYGDTLLRTDSSTASSWIGNYSTESVKFTTWASNTIYMKNLSVKPL